MIAKITPLIRLPSKIDSFDYFVPDDFKEKIKIGQLVSIPWRNKKLPGVVLSLAEKAARTKFRARPIAEILDDNPVLSKSQLKLIKKFSEYYFCSEAYAARLICPDKPKRKIKSSEQSFEDHKFSISKSQLGKLEDSLVSLRGSVLRTKQSDRRVDIKIQDTSSFIWLILHLIKRTKGQVLVLFPTIDLINAAASVVHKKCSAKMAIIHSELSKGKYWEQHQKVLSGRARIILSTRQGVFLPIAKQSKIIFFESTSHDFKQYDQHPRYDARIAAQWVSEITNSETIFASASESLLTRHPERSKAESKDLRELPPASNTRTAVKLIDMKQEMNKKDFSIIADSVLDNIKKTIQNNKKVLIISLRQDSEDGVSVNKIAQILTNQIKNCRISVKYDPNFEFDILVTTAYPLEASKLSSMKRKFDIAVFASIEPLLAIPDFRSGQRTFNRLNFWKIMCSELRISQIILQSYSPDNLAIRAFAYGEVGVFKKAELKHAKELNYPPFSQLIKLWLRRHSERSESEVKNLVDWAIALLTRSFANAQDEVAILGPFKDKKDYQSLLLKVADNTDLSVLYSLPHHWVIDRDPENVL